MWIPIITSLVCFAVATILFTPPLRKFPFYQAVSFYFLFEGAWTLFNTLITAIWPYADFMIWVHHVGIILFAGYLFYKIYVYYWRQRREEKRETEQAAGEKELSKENDEERKRTERQKNDGICLCGDVVPDRLAADLEAEKGKPGFCIRRRDFLVYGRLVAGGCPAAPA